ncbi:hypothetical protein B0H19DRAFT_1069427 [Mycena capillaripes]|nr:hypothetical protein B0H19DRAFT_1069427 [Mycena capillaripes]
MRRSRVDTLEDQVLSCKSPGRMPSDGGVERRKYWAGTLRMRGCSKKLTRNATHGEQREVCMWYLKAIALRTSGRKLRAMRSTSACVQDGGKEEGDYTIINCTHVQTTARDLIRKGMRRDGTEETAANATAVVVFGGGVAFKRDVARGSSWRSSTPGLEVEHRFHTRRDSLA